MGFCLQKMENQLTQDTPCSATLGDAAALFEMNWTDRPEPQTGEALT